MEKIFIIDAVNYLFRSYYAIGPMSNKKGVATSALFGFIRSVQKLLKEFNPKHVIAVFDGPDNKKERQKLFADYKMHRKKAPDDLYPQIELAYRFCEMAGIPALSVPGVEADDTMATIALWAQKQKIEVFLCTSDKDLFQLVSDHLFVLMAHKNNLVVDSQKVKEIYGVGPEQMLDFLAITGDASDNIPGISGFGPKTAAQLLNQFQTLEYILEHPEKVAGAKKQETLIKEKETALLSKQLATLNTTVEVPKEKQFYLRLQPKTEELEEFYAEMNFSSLLKELKTDQMASSSSQSPEEKSEKKKEEPHKIKDPLPEAFCHLIQTEEALEKLIQTLSVKKEICLDTETDSLNFLEAKIVGLGLGIKPEEAFYIPFNGQLKPEKILQIIRPLFENPDIAFYGHNLKYDLQVLLNYGLQIKHICFDTILASYLLNPAQRRHSLDQLALEYFGKVKISFDSLAPKGSTLFEASIESVGKYCVEDVDCTIRLKQLFEKELSDKNLNQLFFEMELPLIFVLAGMERTGIFLEKEKLNALKAKLTSNLHVLEEKIFEDIGEKINLNSPKQLSEVLFQKLQLPLPKKRKTGFSTGADVLEKLALKYPIAEKILKLRAWQKLLTTYVEALPKEINPKTGRIHPTFNQSITATGRLSCQNPNLQNIPIKSEEGTEIRKAFRPEKPGWSYLSADYSQIELRLLAHFSEDPELIKAFAAGQDIHSYTASLLFEVPVENVTKEMRRIAKTVNFGTLYGQGPFGLTQQLNLSYSEAEAFIRSYFQRYPKVKNYLEKCKEQAALNEQTTTLFGRIRPLPEINSPNKQLKAASERLAVNTPLQGTAADLIKIAMIRIFKTIQKEKLQGRLILQIHDELIFEVPDNELERFKNIVKKEMEGAALLKVALTIHLGVGKNWSEC